MLTACKFLATVSHFILAETRYRFRWASLQLELLCAQKLDEDVRSKLGRLPPKLEQLYAEVYDQLMLYSGDAGRHIIDNTLKWLLGARRTLNAPEFLWAVTINLSVPFEDVTREIVLDLCHNLVLYDEDLDIFRFSHLSVREFFENRPEFFGTVCETFAADSCLLHMIASSSFAGAESTLGDKSITYLRQRIASSTGSTSAKFAAYANDFWMVHCQRVPGTDRIDDTSIGRKLQYFVMEESVQYSAFNAWIQWYCSIIQRDDGPELQLQTLLIDCSDLKSRWFFVAVAYGFTEIVDAFLQTEGLSKEEKGKALLLAVKAAQYDAFDRLWNDKVDWEITEIMLYHALLSWDRERLAGLLDKSTSLSISRRMLKAACRRRRGALLLEKCPKMTVSSQMLEDAIMYRYQEMINLLLARASDSVITERVLEMAMRHDNQETINLLLVRASDSIITERVLEMAMRHDNQEMIALLLARASDSIITERVLKRAIDLQQSKYFELLLDRAGDSCLTSSLMAYVAAEKKRKTSMEVMLTRGKGAKITEAVMIEAAGCPDEEMLVLLLLHGGVVTQEVLIRVAHRVSARVLDVLLEKGCEINGQILTLAAQISWQFDYDNGLGVILNRADEAIIAEEIDGLLCHVALNSPRTAIMRRLLDHADITKISEDIIIAAAQNTGAGSELMQILLEQGRVLEITEDVLPYAVANLKIETVLPLLERVEITGIADVLLEAAAGNQNCGGELVRILLREVRINEFPEKLLHKAMRNPNGTKVILALEEVFGRIEMTEEKMVTLVREATNVELLSGWLDPALITEKVLISAMSNSHENVRNAIAEKSLHILITIDVLKAVAQQCDLPRFRFLWNRSRIPKVTEDLMKEVAKSDDSFDIVEFLLDEAEEVQTGDEFMMAVAGESWYAVDIFNLLIERGIHFEIKEATLKAATLNSNTYNSPVFWILQRNVNLKITDDIFKIAASNVHEATLQRLSEYCGMESTPEKWLDIVRMYNAAWRGETDRLKYVLDRGVDPNVARPDGRTPLFIASSYGQKLAVQVLLSAGAEPDPISYQYTPLCYAAEDSHYEIVEMLVEAGASLDFRNEEGYTPAMIARDNGHLKVFRYLEQCRQSRQ